MAAIIREVVAFGAVLALPLVLAACTGSSGTPASSPPPTTVSRVGPATPVGPASGLTTSPSAPAPKCGPARPLTVASKVVVTREDTHSIAPGGTFSVSGLRPQTVVVARATGAPAHGLIAALNRRLRVQVVELGADSGRAKIPVGTVHNLSRDNRTYVLFSAVRRYSGRFAVTCGGVREHGRYTTFGDLEEGTYACSSPAHSAVLRAIEPACR